MKSPNSKRIKKFKSQLTKAETFDKPRYDKAVNLLSSLPFKELVELIKTNSLPALEMAIGSVIIHAVQKGDIQRLETLTSRMIGPIPKKIDMSMKSISDLFADDSVAEQHADAEDLGEADGSE